MELPRKATQEDLLMLLKELSISGVQVRAGFARSGVHEHLPTLPILAMDVEEKGYNFVILGDESMEWDDRIIYLKVGDEWQMLQKAVRYTGL